MQVKYTIAAEGVSTGGPRPESADGAVMINLTQPRTLPRAAYGDKVVVSGKILALHGYQNSGQMDAVHSLKLQGITARMATNSQSFTFRPVSSRSWQAKMAEGRQSVTKVIMQAMAPEDAALLIGILFGGYYARKKLIY